MLIIIGECEACRMLAFQGLGLPVLHRYGCTKIMTFEIKETLSGLCFKDNSVTGGHPSAIITHK